MTSPDARGGGAMDIIIQSYLDVATSRSFAAKDPARQEMADALTFAARRIAEDAKAELDALRERVADLEAKLVEAENKATLFALQAAASQIRYTPLDKDTP